MAATAGRQPVGKEETPVSRKQITIYDIAREAGVSPATVSRILTGSTKVREEKRASVMALIQKYNYSPNAMARGLSETKSRLLGMTLADATNPYYNSLYSACVNEAYSRGYAVMMFNTLSRAELEEAAIVKLREQRVDAVIVCGGRIDLAEPDPAFDRLLRATLDTTPVVVASRSRVEGVPGVSVDHEGSVDLAMEYLIGLGHRGIGFVYTGSQYYGTREKLTRFRLCMERAGLTPREEWIIAVDGYDCESGREGIDRLMELPERPTALLGLNDVIASGMLQGLLSHGVSVPGDMSLVGFDDTFITRITTPQLTAVGYDYGEYARMLIDAALEAAGGARVRANRRVAPELRVKDSCRETG